MACTAKDCTGDSYAKGRPYGDSWEFYGEESELSKCKKQLLMFQELSKKKSIELADQRLAISLLETSEEDAQDYAARCKLKLEIAMDLLEALYTAKPTKLLTETLTKIREI